MKLLTDHQESLLLNLISKGIECIELENLVLSFVTNAHYGDISDAVHALYRVVCPKFQVWFRTHTPVFTAPSFSDMREMRLVYRGQFKATMTDDFARLHELKEVFTTENWESPHFECTDEEWERDEFERELSVGDIIVLKRGLKEEVYLVSNTGLDVIWRVG